MNKARILKINKHIYKIIDLKSNIIFDNAILQGKLKMKQDIFKAGDFVSYEIINEKVIIKGILERFNTFIRPKVSNISKVILTFSANYPLFSFELLDMFLLSFINKELKIELLITKIDLIENDKLKDLKLKLNYYLNNNIIDNIYYVNNLNFKSFQDLKIFKDEVVVLSGQTGVGKSSFINNITGLNLETNEISKALNRGKHTTRVTEIFKFLDGFIVDSPGFSKIDIFIKDEFLLKNYYPDFIKFSSSCKYLNKCNHINDLNCNIIKNVNNNVILKSRYDNYIKFYQKIRQSRLKNKKR